MNEKDMNGEEAGEEQNFRIWTIFTPHPMEDQGPAIIFGSSFGN